LKKASFGATIMSALPQVRSLSKLSTPPYFLKFGMFPKFPELFNLIQLLQRLHLSEQNRLTL
jgi:hypothetical protein